MPGRKEVSRADVFERLDAWTKLVEKTGPYTNQVFWEFAAALAEYTVSGFEKLATAAADALKAAEQDRQAAADARAAAEANERAMKRNAMVTVRLTGVIAFATAAYTLATIVYYARH
jgi:hypothetical protein